MADPISAPVRTFISQHVRSLRGLELLLLLQSDATRVWSASELSQELRATALWAEEELRFFEAVGLVVRPDPSQAGFSYAPIRKELAETVKALQAIYAVRPYAVTQAIFASPRDSIQQFADAFRLRKENPDG